MTDVYWATGQRYAPSQIANALWSQLRDADTVRPFARADKTHDEVNQIRALVVDDRVTIVVGLSRKALADLQQATEPLVAQLKQTKGFALEFDEKIKSRLLRERRQR